MGLIYCHPKDDLVVRISEDLLTNLIRYSVADRLFRQFPKLWSGNRAKFLYDGMFNLNLRFKLLQNVRMKLYVAI